ncbi:MAG TPA: HEAT repeat domain-containing protein [Acidobacteriaceae bacterium]|nr:HEAT repeat domain-containing protein [Acidobacteriaceae bacterium]
MPAPIERLIRALDSLTDGELAVDVLICHGREAIEPLAEFLLYGDPRTIAIPRVRAVRALGGLDARDVLLSYFDGVAQPKDPVVLFAEDAVRSQVARELARWRSEEIFQAILKAAKQRATTGLIETLGEFARQEAIPLLFENLEDDLCRGAAFSALMKTPGATREYAILTLRRKTRTKIDGQAAAGTRRGVARLLRKLKIDPPEWRDVSALLQDDDPTVVISAAAMGFCAAEEEEFPEIVKALLRVARRVNWLEEDEMITLLEEHKEPARRVAKQIVADLQAHGEHANWLSPMWRVLGHVVHVDSAGSER